MPTSTFGIEKEFLPKLLDQAAVGTLQLPEFQRGWVWPLENIRSLLASISLGYPVGTLMMLASGGDIQFKERPVEGTAPTKEPLRLLLDGQQRLTSLYQALKLGKPIRTQDVRNRELSGWFYVDMQKAVTNPVEREDAFLFVPEDRKVRNFRGEVELDLSVPELEYQHKLFPLCKTFDEDDWIDGFDDYWDATAQRSEMRDLRKDLRNDFLKTLSQYQLPVIELGVETPREAVCQVFEKVNTGGVSLTVFELLTATYAANEFDLREDWKNRRHIWSAAEYKLLNEVSNTDFLQAVTLLTTYAIRQSAAHAGMDETQMPRIGCRRGDILNLPLEHYQQWAPAIVDGYLEAARMMNRLYIYDVKFLPYGSQLIPLSVILSVLGDDASSAGARQKIHEWLWCGIFGELYGGTTETRFARDVPEVVAWVRGSSTPPRTVLEAQFLPGRLDTLRTRGSAAYKGLYALLMRQGAKDWITDGAMSVTTYFDEQIDIHHIFPRAWCEKQSIPPQRFNSIINKTPITARTNRIIGGQAPSRYFPQVVRKAETTVDVVRSSIESHLVDVDLLTADDFDAFYETRRSALLQLVIEAMGKPVEDIRNQDKFAVESEDES